MNVNDRTLPDLDRLEELDEGELALVRHEGVTAGEPDVAFRVLQDVLHEVWTVIADDFLTPLQLMQIQSFLPPYVVLYDLHTDALGITTLTWLERKDAVVCGP